MKLSILVCFLLGLTLGTVLFWLNKESPHRIKSTWVLIITIVLSFCGFALAIAEDYLSQYDHDPNTVIEYEGYKNKGVSFDHLIKRMPTTSPEYIFVLDISGSTKGKQPVELTGSIKDQIAAIKKTALLNPSIDLNSSLGVNYKENTIPFFDLLKVRLLYSLSMLREMKYDEINYRIVYFAGDCYAPPVPNKNLDERIKDSYDEILRTKPIGKNTDFVALLELINEHLVNSSKMLLNSPQHSFDRKDVIVVFLTDYIHDVRNENAFETRRSLEQSIKGLEETNVHLKLCMITDEDSSNNSNSRIDKMLQEILSPNYYNKLDLREFKNTFNYLLMMPTPIPFYYSNSTYENSLRTSMAFSFEQNRKICFSLGNDSDNKRLIYRLSVGNMKYPLSVNGTKIDVHEGEKVFIEILGYIQAPYKSPDIILEDESMGAQFVFPVVFVRNCPKTVFVLLWMIFGLVVSGVIISIRIRRQAGQKNIVKRKVENNDKESSGKEYDVNFVKS